MTGGLNIIGPPLAFDGWSTLDVVGDTDSAREESSSEPANALGEGKGDSVKRSSRSSCPGAEVEATCAAAIIRSDSWLALRLVLAVVVLGGEVGTRTRKLTRS